MAPRPITSPRRIMLSIDPDPAATLGHDPETIGSPEVRAVLLEYAQVVEAAAREVAQVFSEAEWRALAKAVTGDLGTKITPKTTLVISTLDVAGASAEWYAVLTEGGGAELVAKVARLSEAQSAAVLAATRWARGSGPTTLENNSWWLPSYRRARAASAAAAAEGGVL
ncbi:hypothetical protein [Paludisphaera sp.]|uniref:hypothetical protein n=1 Tax=Paludisphaera sp. TaxID=2017432 RepID=UPI00301CEBEF